jgi:site-specific DNA recombinase
MRVALYFRVSTLEQRDEGYSLENQKERLIAFAKSQGWDDYGLYMDDGYTGTDMNRPGLKRLIRHVEDKLIQAVVVLKLDRLSRKQKDALYLLEDVFDKNGVIFKSATEPFDTSTPLGKAMIGVLAVFAQLERDMIVERTTSGRRQRVSGGKWYGGPVPFGYSWNKEAQELEIVPEEAQLIKDIFTRYLQGQSRLSIAEWVSTRSTARTFDHSTVKDMLSRPVYMGKLANAGTLVEGNHESIIEAEQWYEVQLELQRRKEGLSPIGEYLLTGLLRCGVCGGPIVHVKRTTKPRGKTYSYELYACKSQHVRYKDRDNHCSLGYFHREKIEEFVINQIKNVVEVSSDNINNYMELYRDRDDSQLIRTLENKIDVVNEQMSNLYDAIQSGAIKAQSVSERIRSLEEEREATYKQLDDLKFNTPQLNSASNVIRIIQQVGDAWDELNEEERKQILRKVILGIRLNKEDAHEIEWNVLM